MSTKKSYGTIETNNNLGDRNASKWYHIDVETLPAKMCYFFVNMKEAAYTPYLILYFTSVGLSVTQAGIIAGFRLIGMLLGAPIWGMVDDRWKRPQVLISILCIVSSAFMVQMPFVAAKLQPSNTCLITSEDGVNMTSNTSCGSSSPSSISCHECVASGSQAQFWFHLIVTLIMMFFDGALIGLTDSAVMSLIQSSTRKLDFGRQRVFGAVGFGVGTLTTSLLIGSMPRPYPGISKYWSAFFVYAFAVLCYAGSAMLLFRRNLSSTKKSEGTKSSLVTVVVRTISQFHVLFFLSTSLVTGILFGLVTSFTFKLMAEMDSPEFLLGLSTALGSVGSIVLFAFTTKLIHVLGGPMPTIGLAVFVYFVRFVVYGYARSPYLIFAIQAVHCFTFAPFVASAVMFVRMSSPEEILSTMYSIMNGLHFGAGSIVANWLGGFLYERWGGPWLFKASAVLSFFWVGLIAIYVVREKCQKNWKVSSDNEKDVLIINRAASEC